MTESQELKPLTKTQNLIFEFIKGFIDENSYSPTSKDIQKRFDFKSVNAAFEHLKWIEKKGYIKRTPNVARSIVVLQA